MGISRPTSQGAHHHADEIYLALLTGNREWSKRFLSRWASQVVRVPHRFHWDSVASISPRDVGVYQGFCGHLGDVDTWR